MAFSLRDERFTTDPFAHDPILQAEQDALLADPYAMFGGFDMFRRAVAAGYEQPRAETQRANNTDVLDWLRSHRQSREYQSGLQGLFGDTSTMQAPNAFDQSLGLNFDVFGAPPAYAGTGEGDGSDTAGAVASALASPDLAGLTERDLLAMTIQGEAGSEGAQGKLAVGAVVANRAASGRYGGNSLSNVILKPGQFSMFNGLTGYAGGEGAIDLTKLRIRPDTYAIADMILSGQYIDPTGGATHYYNPSVANPAWGQRKAGGDWLTIGNHIFGRA